MKLNLRICAKQYQHIDNQNSHNQYIRLIHLSDDFVPHWTCQFLPVAFFFYLYAFKQILVSFNLQNKIKVGSDFFLNFGVE